MHIVLGGTGRVGSAVARHLLERGEPVTVVARDPLRARALVERGAEAVACDVRDVDALRAVLRRGRRAFVLNPPADPAGDSDAEERAGVRALLAAVDGSGLERVVAQSTYGARAGEALGDLSALHRLEQGLRGLPVATTAVRAAYYMSNWDAQLGSARDEGVLSTLFPPDMPLPMVAPDDLGRVGARLLASGPERRGDLTVTRVEGPERYTARDVAAAFGAALGRSVEAVGVPRERWEETLRDLGFSEAAARSYARMTAVVVDGADEGPDAPERGRTGLHEYVAGLVDREGHSSPS